MKTIPSSFAVIATLAVGASAAAGQASNEAYLSAPSDGSVVMDTFGNCVRTSDWSPKRAIEGCGHVVRTVTLESDALFAFNSAFLNREGQPGALQKLIERVSGLRSIEAVHIVGHTDNIGPSTYNQRLSEQRAGSTKDFLIKSGIDPAKITIMGMGERSPVADNSTRDGRARNRRVVIMFKGLAQDN